MHDDEQRVMMPPTEINYNPIDHGFFHELVRLVVCLSAAGLAFDLHKNGHVTPYGAKQPLVVEGKPDISGLELHFFPSLLYQQSLKATDKQPAVLRVLKIPLSSSPPTHPLQLSNIQLIISRLISDAFLSYYERKSSVVREKWGETNLWPQSWRFGWAMRNACAHDGKIFCKNKDYSAVWWKSRRYDYADNGRQIFFDEIAGADLILLMEDLDRCLKFQMQDE